MCSRSATRKTITKEWIRIFEEKEIKMTVGKDNRKKETKRKIYEQFEGEKKEDV